MVSRVNKKTVDIFNLYFYGTLTKICTAGIGLFTSVIFCQISQKLSELRKTGDVSEVRIEEPSIEAVFRILEVRKLSSACTHQLDT